MEYEFKKGDRVRRYKNGRVNGTDEKDTGVVTTDIFTNDGEYSLKYILDKNNQESSGYVRNYELISPKEKPKAPTYLVVWEIKGCGDPCRFFTSEKEAKEYVKTLSEDSKVDQNSVILVEVKSSKKVSVKRSVVFAQHKI
ncbi:hypothetical protein KAI04_04285 [Candidatus Pacearchaeota archaeon]|nr:hypothetical protein [Candidatus Pacearchaeota archaeon]